MSVDGGDGCGGAGDFGWLYNLPHLFAICFIQVVKTFGNDYSYDLCPRAKIFRRDNTNATDIMSLGSMYVQKHFCWKLEVHSKSLSSLECMWTDNTYYSFFNDGQDAL